MKTKLSTSQIVVGIIAVTLFAVALSSFSSSKKTAESLDYPVQTTEVEMPITSEDGLRERVIVPFGETGQLSTLSLQVHGFEQANTISGVLHGTTQTKVDATFILVDMSVTNLTNSTFTLYPKGMLLSSREGVTYDIYQATSGGAIGYEKRAIDARNLGNGIEERGVLVYEVSKDFVPYALEIEKSGTNDTLIFELEKEEQEAEPQLLSYRIIETEDFSYAGCKRIGVRLVVPDESSKTDVNFTLKRVADNYINQWDDITIWAWGYSEEADVGASGFTKGMYETGSCS